MKRFDCTYDGVEECDKGRFVLYVDADKAIRELTAQRDELLAACKEPEWGGQTRYGPSCPCCGALKESEENGECELHESDCKLMLAIARAEAKEPTT